MTVLTMNWDSPGGCGMPSTLELQEALVLICTDIGGGADAVKAVVQAWGPSMPGAAELAVVCKDLRTLVGDTDTDYEVNFGPLGEGTGGPGIPSGPELKTLLGLIHTSI